MRFMNSSNARIQWMGNGRAGWVAVVIGVAVAGVACSGKDKGSEGSAAHAVPSGIPAAPPRALGPGAATLGPSTVSEPSPKSTDDPFAPFVDPPDAGPTAPPSEPLPL